MFTHLHVHTEYSLLDGACKINQLVEAAARQGCDSLAITDHGAMYGVVDFYKAAQKAGIKPILGCEVYVAQRSRHQKEARKDDSPYHLLLLAQNQEGYKNLLALVSQAFLEGFYYRPRVDRELLARHHRGLVAASACLAGEIPQLLLKNRYREAVETAAFYADLFGKDNFYLELQDHGMEEQRLVNRQLVELARELNLPLVATNDAHYIRQDQAGAHEVLLCIQTGKNLQDENRMRFPSQEFYLKSEEEMARLFGEIPQSLTNTRLIAESCNLTLDFGTLHLPHYQVPEGYTLDSYLEHLCREGAARRFGSNPPAEIFQRLKYELGVISQMGFSSYFLIVWDMVNFAREQGILVGPGRGSAAGSLVAYVLGITNINPLEHGLLFERFLNPERVSMPDIDIDFCYERRGEVINYVSRKYGSDHVAQIITFGTMAARGAIRDVGRALNVPYNEVDRLAKLVPEELGITLDRALQVTPELQSIYQEQPQFAQLLDLAREVEGMPRHASTHAAGLVISQEPLVNYLPLARTSDGLVTTQFPMQTVEELGLLKMDLLGLRTLTVIGKAQEIIQDNRSQVVDIDGVGLEDPATYQMLSSGESLGVFQLESSGMRAILHSLKPERFEDIVALVALYRPGPLGSGMVEDFINRKHGVTSVEYLLPQLEPILEETYGVILYQEQVMRIASDIAGFTLGEADLLRRAMGKKKPEIIAGLRQQFIEGAGERGVEEKTASEIFSLMEFFAGYGFNKCLTGDTLIWTAEQGPKTLKDIYRSQWRGPVISLEPGGGLTVGQLSEIWDNGLQKVYRLLTAGGRTIKATSTHRFLTRQGWMPLCRLEPGMEVMIAHQGMAADGSLPPASLDQSASLDHQGSVWWDPVQELEPAGRARTFDVQVDPHHSLVANGLVVHNSHSAAYALVAYQTAYLKANYRVEFLTSLMSSIMEHIDKIPRYIEECRRLGVEVLPPDVNYSQADFRPVGDKIRFGLAAVKNVGRSAIQSILEVREAGGPFTSLLDFCERIDQRQVNRKVIESLICCGAFASLGARRSQLMDLLDQCLDMAGIKQEDRARGQVSLFDLVEETGAQCSLPDIPEYPPDRLLSLEKEYLGFYFSGHPATAYHSIFEGHVTAPIGQLGDLAPEETICLGGIFTSLRRTTTKKGDPMGYARLEDASGTIEVLLFPATYARFSQELEVGRVYLIQGRILGEEEQLRLMADEVIPLPSPQILRLTLPPGFDWQGMISLREVLRQFHGYLPVQLDFPHLEARMRLGKEFWVSDQPELTARLANLLGPEAVNFISPALLGEAV